MELAAEMKVKETPNTVSDPVEDAVKKGPGRPPKTE